MSVSCTLPSADAILDATGGPRLILEQIADKWALVILAALHGGPLRHGDLKRACGPVSQKMLTQTLRDLERDGLVSRKVYTVVPPRVEYARTALGDSLGDLICELSAWAQAHQDEIARARRHYDAATEGEGR